ncbi:hypothetical protein B0H13DRAFT_2003971 [Mycena leptocephala]|nr:hypothetical protein B0H13DRAFT_2003971 [Mycena leptocephala]
MSSPFASKLGTNYCPKDEEVVEIKGLLILPTLRLKLLDDEIADLQQAIDELARERRGLRAYVEAHQALISPFRRLPVDLIQEIFLACMPTHRNCVMSASEAPVLLGRICSSWRVISISTPRLWSRVHVVDPTPPDRPTSTLYEEKLAQRLETTKTWLARSGQCPLSISLASMRLPGEEFPMLETVVFSAHLIYEARGMDMQHFGILRGPRVSSFSIPGSNFIPEKLPLRWHQLTNLSITGPPSNVLPSVTSETMLSVISRCPELRSCSLMVNDGIVAKMQSPHSTVEFPFLHTFTLQCVGSVQPAFELLSECLSLPELRIFTLRGCTDRWNSPSLARFFTRTVRLQSLEIDSDTFWPSSLFESLRALPPTLCELRINDTSTPPLASSLNNTTLTALISAPGCAIHCPALRSIRIKNCCVISDRAVLRLIASRMTTDRCALTHVEIQFSREMTVDIRPDLQPFIERGLRISITHLAPPSLHFSPWQGLADDTHER